MADGLIHIQGDPTHKPIRPVLDFSNPINEGRIGVWAHYEGGGDTVHDIGPYQLHGTVQSAGMNWVRTRYGFAGDYVGNVGDWVACGTSPLLETPKDSTYITRFNVDAVSPPNAGSILASKSTLIGSSGIEWAVLDATKKIAMVWNDGGVKGFYTSTSTITYGTWVWVAFVRSVQDGKVYIYIDGKLDASVTAATADIVYSSDVFKIGEQPNNVEFNGKIEFASLWNRALSAAEVALLYHRPYEGIIPSRYVPVTAAAAVGDAIQLVNGGLVSAGLRRGLAA